MTGTKELKVQRFRLVKAPVPAFLIVTVTGLSGSLRLKTTQRLGADLGGETGQRREVVRPAVKPRPGLQFGL